MNLGGSKSGKGEWAKGRLSFPSNYKTFHNLPVRGKSAGLRDKKKGINMVI